MLKFAERNVQRQDCALFQEKVAERHTHRKEGVNRIQYYTTLYNIRTTNSNNKSEMSIENQQRELGYYAVGGGKSSILIIHTQQLKILIQAVRSKDLRITE